MVNPPEGVEMEEERGKSRRFKSYFRKKWNIDEAVRTIRENIPKKLKLPIF